MQAPFRRICLSIIAFALLAIGCSTPGETGNGNGTDPASNLIVAGERIGDLPPIGSTGSGVRALPYDDSLEIVVPPATSYRFRNEDQEVLYSISVCASDDLVWLILLYNMPENERYATSEGVSVRSSESDVVAALGEPDRTRDVIGRRLLDYGLDDGVPTLSIAFDVDDATQTLYIAVGSICQE